MDTFLGNIASHLVEKYKDSISELCIVLPNRRASLFLRKHLSKNLKKTAWSPQIYSIEDFIFKLSDLNVLDNTSLLFELYEIHKTIAKDKQQDFDEFTKWGQVLLHDFNEIDQHLAPAKSLFNYLTDLKSLSNWNPQQAEPTEFQKQYISFFQSLYIYYEALNNKISTEKAAYTGSAYKFVAENILEISKSLEWDKIIFAGFNALTTAEEKIIFDLGIEGKSEILWDADHYYLKKSEAEIYHEAGFFIRKYLKKHKESTFNWIGDHFQTEEKNIQIYGVPKQIGQAKLCGQILNEQPEIIEAKHNSAIVLSDENLLFPILNSLPNLKELNATMGIPLSSTPVYDFIKSILEMLQKSFLHQKMQKRNENAFHINDIQKILNHSVLSEICEEAFGISIPDYQHIIKSISKSNQVVFTSNNLKNKIEQIYSDSSIIRLIFSQGNEDVDSILKNIRSILEQLRDALILKQKSKNIDLKIEIEYIYQLSILFTKIYNYQTKYKALKSIKSLLSFFNQLSRTEKLSLYGEPLKGLQLMGVLETRTLDFENLILCSVNENILPGSGKQNSFIPFDIRHEYNLPTYREKNAVFAYHFFRLIQRAKNIHLIYNTEADPIAGGDKSRFLYQLQEEFKGQANIKIEERIVSTPLSPEVEHPIQVEKTKDIIKILIQKAHNGFSPSSLNTYKRCPLQFYYKEIAKLGEPEKNKEVIDAATLGNIIHEILQEIFEPLKLKNVEADYLEEHLKNLKPLLQKSFDKLYEDGDIKTGKNLLVSKVAERFIRNYLKHEIKKIKKGDSVFIKSLEEYFTTKIPINNYEFPDDLKTLNFKGIIDRIDTINGQLRIIDYKTGTVKKSDLVIKDWESLFTDPKTDKSFQLVFYAWLYYKQSRTQETSIPGIFSLKKLSEGFIDLKTPDKGILNPEDFKIFENSLINLLKNIFDQQIPFTQTDDINFCSYCNYKIICNK